MSDEPAEHALVMPFLPVASKGGPFDDAAYTAGWEMGLLDSLLARPAEWPPGDPELVRTLRAENREQADLLAMRHGLVATFEEMPPAIGAIGWIFARFRRGIELHPGEGR